MRTLLVFFLTCAALAAAPRAEAQNGPRPGTAEDFLLSVGDRVFFPRGEAVLVKEAEAVVERQAAWLVTHSTALVVIVGGADENAMTVDNLGLGRRRAQAVASALTARGVEPHRIFVVSKGSRDPLDPRGGALNWQAQTQVFDVPAS